MIEITPTHRSIGIAHCDVAFQYDAKEICLGAGGKPMPRNSNYNGAFGRNRGARIAQPGKVDYEPVDA